MNIEQLAIALGHSAQTLGVLPEFWRVRPQFHLHGLDCTPSTNAIAWQLIDQDAPAGTVVVATRQAAGRGQWGRQWQSPPGGLYLSLVLRPEIPVSALPQITLASAWGIVASLGNLQVSVHIKWPNDLIARGRKLGGILTETRIEHHQVMAAVVGVGLNYANPVPPMGITLQELIHPDSLPPALESLEALAAVVLYGLWQGQLYWQTHGTDLLMAVYQTHLAHVGQIIDWDGHSWEVLGVTANGTLRVHCIDDLHKSQSLRSNQLQNPLIIRELAPGEITLGYNS